MENDVFLRLIFEVQPPFGPFGPAFAPKSHSLNIKSYNGLFWVAKVDVAKLCCKGVPIGRKCVETCINRSISPNTSKFQFWLKIPSWDVVIQKFGSAPL